MKFRDEKIVKYVGQEFEHARIVQGMMIYTIFIAFSIAALIQDEIKYGLGILGIIVSLYVVFTVSTLFRSSLKIKQACVIGLLKLITFPTSTLG